MTLTINIIGAGQLGKVLGRELAKRPDYNITGICNRHFGSAEKAIAFIGQGRAFESVESLPEADITFITTTDKAIEPTAMALSQSPLLKPGSIVAHCSGVHNHSLLNPLKKKQCMLASLHPMRTFANPETANFKGAYASIEGETEAKKTLRAIFTSLGAILFPIDPSLKASYHVAGTFASNYLITLASISCHALEKAGIEQKDALAITIDLMKGSLDNLATTQSASAALTGPMARGDIETISKHLETLDEPTKAVYSALGQMTLPLTPLDDTQQTCLSQLLKK
jgi:predicted short-subunit dehydrogenase-like oxidoreductase (DUF2520 family)